MQLQPPKPYGRNAASREFQPRHTDGGTEAHRGLGQGEEADLTLVTGQLLEPTLVLKLQASSHHLCPHPPHLQPMLPKTDPASSNPVHPSRKPTADCPWGSPLQLKNLIL